MKATYIFTILNMFLMAFILANMHMAFLNGTTREMSIWIVAAIQTFHVLILLVKLEISEVKI